jgi:hypothetical protein
VCWYDGTLTELLSFSFATASTAAADLSLLLLLFCYFFVTTVLHPMQGHQQKTAGRPVLGRDGGRHALA